MKRTICYICGRLYLKRDFEEHDSCQECNEEIKKGENRLQYLDDK